MFSCFVCCKFTVDVIMSLCFRSWDEDLNELWEDNLSKMRVKDAPEFVTYCLGLTQVRLLASSFSITVTK